VSVRAPRLLLLAAASAAGCGPSEAAPGDGGAPPASGEAKEFAGRSRARLDVELRKPQPGDPAQAAPLVEEAKRALALGQLPGALKVLDEALRLDPAFLDALILRGSLQLERTAGYDPAQALLSYRLAELVDGGSVAARVGEVVARVELEDDERAAALIEELLRDESERRLSFNDGQRAALHRSRARVALRAGRFEDALRDADAALSARGVDRISLQLRAEILERSGRAADADADLVRSLQVKPDDGTAHFARARVLRRLSRTADAEREMRIYQALLPFEQEASKAFMTDWPRRIALRRDLVAAYPEFRRARHLLVRELLGGKELDLARAELDKLVNEQSDDAEAWYLLAKVRAQKGDAAGARDAADRMLATKKTQRAVYDDLLREIESVDAGK